MNAVQGGCAVARAPQTGTVDALEEWLDHAAFGSTLGCRREIGECVVDESILALGASIGSDALREAVAGSVPAPLQAGIRAGGGGLGVRVEELYARVQQACGLRADAAIEIVQVFFERLAEGLAPEVRAALRVDLGDDWCALLVDPMPPLVTPLHARAPRSRSAREDHPRARAPSGSMRPLYSRLEPDPRNEPAERTLAGTRKEP